MSEEKMHWHRGCVTGLTDLSAKRQGGIRDSSGQPETDCTR